MGSCTSWNRIYSSNRWLVWWRPSIIHPRNFNPQPAISSISPTLILDAGERQGFDMFWPCFMRFMRSCMIYMIDYDWLVVPVCLAWLRCRQNTGYAEIEIFGNSFSEYLAPNGDFQDSATGSSEALRFHGFSHKRTERERGLQASINAYIVISYCI